jgi:hypothetical protein
MPPPRHKPGEVACRVLRRRGCVHATEQATEQASGKPPSKPLCAVPGGFRGGCAPVTRLRGNRRGQPAQKCFAETAPEARKARSLIDCIAARLSGLKMPLVRLLVSRGLRSLFFPTCHGMSLALVPPACKCSDGGGLAPASCAPTAGGLPRLAAASCAPTVGGVVGCRVARRRGGQPPGASRVLRRSSRQDGCSSAAVGFVVGAWRHAKAGG